MAQLRVLIVDDSPEALTIMSKLFEFAGATVHTCPGGAEAIEAIRTAQKEVPFDMLCLDIRMPEVDGNKVAAAARAEGYTGPIIAFTAAASLTGKTESKNSGIDAYFSKMTLSKDLISALVNEYCSGKTHPV